MSEFTSLETFLNMGGYGLYVWTAYGTFVVILLFQALKHKKKKHAK